MLLTTTTKQSPWCIQQGLRCPAHASAQAASQNISSYLLLQARLEAGPVCAGLSRWHWLVRPAGHGGRLSDGPSFQVQAGAELIKYVFLISSHVLSVCELQYYIVIIITLNVII